MDIIEKLWKAKIPVRLVILKARQEGISTLMEAIGFALTVLNKNTIFKIVSFDDKSAKKIYKMSKRFYRNLPDDVRPETKYDTKSNLVFQSDDEKTSLESEIDIDSAKKLEAGKSETIHVLHISEMAVMNYVKELLAALRNAVPKLPNTIIAVESTARGMGNDFHDQYTKAATLDEVLTGQAALKDKSEYVQIFIPWFWHEEYKMKVPADFKLVDYEHPIYGNEREIKKTYKLDMEQMYWRRHTILNECDGDLDYFRQEYPANEIEAFVASGRVRFSKIALQNYMSKVTEPKAVGDIKVLETAQEALERYGRALPELYWEDDPIGDFKIWKFPEKNVNYVMGVDVSEGIIVDPGDRRKTDFSVCSVWRRDPWEKVAMWRSKIDADLLADICYRLGHMYNYCWIGVEKNNHGLTTLKFLQRQYSRIYYKEVMDEKTQEKTRKLGWVTDATVRGFMIDCLAKVIRNETALIYCKETIQEYLTFIIYPDGRIKAQSGKTDDIVLADCIALQVHRQMPMIRYEDRSMKMVADFSPAG